MAQSRVTSGRGNRKRDPAIRIILGWRCRAVVQLPAYSGLKGCASGAAGHAPLDVTCKLPALIEFLPHHGDAVLPPNQWLELPGSCGAN